MVRRRKLVLCSALASAGLLGATFLAGGGSLVRGGDAAAAAVAAAGPTNTARPTISGTARQGETLTASTGSWSGTGAISYTYRWQRCNGSGASCADVAGATASTFTLAAADVGMTIGVAVTATDTNGSSTAYSDLAGPVAPEGSSPAYTVQPTVTGTAKQGQTLKVANGTWNGSTPITFGYQWLRCDSAAKNCDVIAGVSTASYVLTAADVGHTIIVGVLAKNAYGTQTGFTAPTGVVAGTTSLPAWTVQPSVSGTAKEGQTLTVATGTWTGTTPITFSFQWLRCDAAGKTCDVIGGVSAQSYKLASADVGHTIVVGVKATNPAGSQTGFSAPTAVVAASLAPGAAVDVSSVKLPDRLTITGVKFQPSVLRPGTRQFSGRFRVTESAGHPVSGALVYAIALPYGRVSNAPEVRTDANGYATIPFTARSAFGVRRGYVVFFVRARNPTDNLLAGVSTRRLVQVTTGA